jgi:hypothetical protein
MSDRVENKRGEGGQVAVTIPKLDKTPDLAATEFEEN